MGARGDCLLNKQLEHFQMMSILTMQKCHRGIFYDHRYFRKGPSLPNVHQFRSLCYNTTEKYQFWNHGIMERNLCRIREPDTWYLWVTDRRSGIICEVSPFQCKPVLLLFRINTPHCSFTLWNNIQGSVVTLEYKCFSHFPPQSSLGTMFLLSPSPDITVCLELLIWSVFHNRL